MMPQIGSELKSVVLNVVSKLSGGFDAGAWILVWRRDIIGIQTQEAKWFEAIIEWGLILSSN